MLPDNSTKTDERVGILLGYLPTNDGSDNETKRLLYNFLDEWGLTDAFLQNKIAFAVDGALYSAVNKMFIEKNLQPLVSICQPHSFGNMAKRTLDQNLTAYWPEGKQEIEVNFFIIFDRSLLIDRSFLEFFNF